MLRCYISSVINLKGEPSDQSHLVFIKETVQLSKINSKIKGIIKISFNYFSYQI